MIVANTKSIDYRFHLVSALQKYIRRCHKDTLRVAKELYNLGSEQVWKKLPTYGSEDIGIACPTIQTYIFEQKKQYDAETDRYKKRHIFLNTINYMMRQNKSRLCDNINHAYFKDYQPDVENPYDFENAVSAKNLDLALRCAAHLFKKGKEKYILSALTATQHDKHCRILVNHFNRCNTVERNRTDVLFLVHLILYKIMDLDKIPSVECNDLSFDEVSSIFSDNSPIIFEDYVYDKHTRIGRKQNRGMKHFYDHAAQLVNCYIPDPYEKIARQNNIKE